MAPEVVNQEGAGTSVDVYAFGMTAYEMLAGRLPFAGPISEVLTLQVSRTPPPPSTFNQSIPGTLDDAILSPLAKNPTDRPSSLRAVVNGIRRSIDWHNYKIWLEMEVPKRMKMTLAIGLLGTVLAVILPLLGPVSSIENRLVDARISLMAPRKADPRILLLELDEATLDDGAANFFEQADQLLLGVDGLFKAGASGVAIDLVLPRRFSESESLSRIVLDHRKNLVMALYAGSDGKLRGWDCLPQLTRSIYGSTTELASQFGLVNFEPDPDGRIRQFQTSIQAESNLSLAPLSVHLYRWMTLHPTIPARTKIDFSVNPTSLPRLRWSEISGQLTRNPGIFRGRYVIVGADTESQEDRHLIPSIRGRSNQISGPALHALQLQTLLNLGHVRSVPIWAWLWLFLILLAGSVWSLLRITKLLYAWCTVAGFLFISLTLVVWLGSCGIMVPVAGPFLAFLIIVLFAFICRGVLSSIPKAPTNPGVAIAH
jgi:CHASE2 domain-containing sensor protein